VIDFGPTMSAIPLHMVEGTSHILNEHIGSLNTTKSKLSSSWHEPKLRESMLHSKYRGILLVVEMYNKGNGNTDAEVAHLYQRQCSAR
jgi:hypothetical protein